MLTATDPTPTPTAYAPGQKPGPKFARALRRAAEHDLREQSDPLVRDAAGATWRRTHHEGHRAAVARHATAQQVARTKLLRARSDAANAATAAQEAHAAAPSPETERAFAQAKEALERLVAAPLPEVPPVPKAGQPVEIPYVGGDALRVNRYADKPAGTRAEHRRTYPGGMPADVSARLSARAKRAAEREQVQWDRRYFRNGRSRRERLAKTAMFIARYGA